MFSIDDSESGEVSSPPGATATEYGLRARLQAALPGMSPSMAKIARLLLEHPELPIRLSIGEFAAQAQSSAPSVTRLCKLLGYSGYPGLRVGVAAELGRATSVDALLGIADTAARPDMDDSEVVRTFLASHIKALQASADLVDLPQLRSAAGRIARSPHIDIYGVAGSGAVGVGLADRLYQLGLNARSWADIHLGLMSAAILPADSVAIGISSSGQTLETIEMLKAARDRGATTIAVTSNHLSPLASIADLVVRTAPQDDFLDIGVFTAAHVQIFASDLLYLLVSWELPDQTIRNDFDSAVAVASRRVDQREIADRTNPSGSDSAEKARR